MLYRGENRTSSMMAKVSKPRRLCPDCGRGTFTTALRPFEFHGVAFGEFKVHLCDHCGSWYFTAASSRAIDRIARDRGLFGVTASECSHHGVSRRSEAFVPT